MITSEGALIPAHAARPVAELVITDPAVDGYSYEEFVASMAKNCSCPNTVCAGVLAGWFCDSFVADGCEAEDEEYPL